MALAIFALNVVLNAPLFMQGELPFRGSIEGGYVGMARFISQHPNPWGWNPLPYCGLPTQSTYVPGVPYVSALFIGVPARYSGFDVPHDRQPDDVSGPGDAVPLCAVLYGKPVGVVRDGVAYSLMSPSYALFPAVERIVEFAQLRVARARCWRSMARVRTTRVSRCLPLALLALWRAARDVGIRVIAGGGDVRWP